MKRISIYLCLICMLSGISITTAQNNHSTTINDTAKVVKSQNKKFHISDYLSIGGFVNFQYDYETQRDNEENISETNTMQIRRARLDIKGKISPRVEFRLQTEFANSVKLLDAFMKIKICKYVNIQAGQFKTPLTLENPYSPMNLESIENAQVINKLAGYKDVSGISSYSGGREIGFALYGDLITYDKNEKNFPLLSYQLGVYGGNGINVKDNNFGKDFAGRLDFRPFLKDLILSGSAYYGNYAISDTVDGARIRYSGGVEYQKKNWIARAEYVYGETGMFDALAPNYTNNQKSHGFYAVAGYWFHFGWGKNSHIQQKLRPVIRYDYYQDLLSLDATASHYYMAGIEWWPEPHIRFQVNYTLRNKVKNEHLGHSLAAMLSVKF